MFDSRPSHLVLSLPHLPFLLIPPSITSFSIPCSYLTTCPKQLNSVCVTLDSSVHSSLMLSSTTLWFLLSVHNTLVTHLQDHISNASIVSLAISNKVFLILHGIIPTRICPLIIVWLNNLAQLPDNHSQAAVK